jgi:hypothetical protein
MLMVLATSIFLNGVNIDGVRNQSFEKCKSARIDDKGDVQLDCPGYEVERPSASDPAAQKGAQPAPAVPGTVTKRYWLVSEAQDSAAAQYDLDVFVNSKWVRKVKAGEPQIVLEITRFITAGPNKILFAATKHIEAGRKSDQAASYLKITVGEGEAGGNTVTIDNPLIECKRTAAETENVNEEFTIQGR